MIEILELRAAENEVYRTRVEVLRNYL